MELGKRIKAFRNERKWNQDTLAEKMFVSRQTISNWENEKSYPDIQSLLLLSNLFEVTLDQLVKGDVEEMETIINEQDVKALNRYGLFMGIGMLAMMVTTVPLFFYLRFYAFFVFAPIAAFTLYYAYKAEALKKNLDIQTYKEIVAFTKGEKLDEITKQREIGKRPYQKILLALASGGITLLVCIVIGLIMFLLL